MASLPAATQDHASVAAVSAIRVLMDLHHCLQAYSGIGQETRLVFAELAKIPIIKLGGLLSAQSDLSTARPRSGFRDAGDALAQVRLVSEIDRMVTRQKQKKTFLETVLSRYRKSELAWIARLARNRLSGDVLVAIDPSRYGDFLWEKLFSPTLDSGHRREVLEAAYVAVRTGRRSAGTAAGWRAWSARIDTAGWDVLIAQTPFPYRLDAGTRLIVRYHDAIPVFYPHTLSEGELEARRHIRILSENLRRGGFFACVSEPVRQDLLRLAPQAEGRAAVIPDMVSARFWPDRAQHAHIEEIVRMRACPPTALVAKEDKKSKNVAAVASDDSVHPTLSSRFFVAVSTIEPRKNYRMLINAWGDLRRHHPETPDLVLIANPGWRFVEAAVAISRWRGHGLFHLWRVPIEELRLLYSSAQGVVCPSMAEGFDLSGVEAMLCETPVIASDIPVHRWVYGDAALYFDPFDSASLVRLLDQVGSHAKGECLFAALRARGLRQAALYHPEVVASKWHEVLQSVHTSSKIH